MAPQPSPATPATRVRAPASGRLSAPGEDTGSYLNRLTRNPLLTHSEEIRLAQRIAQGGLDGVQAKHRLVECNMRLVVSIAKAYRASGLPLEDLIQEGAIGLMTAAERYDPDRGFRFSTYATQWIRQAIGRAVDNKARSIRLPAHVSELLRKVERARVELRRESGDEPTLEQLAERLNVPARKVTTLMTSNHDPVSLDMPIGDEDSTSLGALLHDKGAVDPQERLLDDEIRTELTAILLTLDERERHVIWRRFGFDGEDHCVLQQIGEELNLSRERIRQIEAQALRKMRQVARKHRLREFLFT